LHDSEKEVLKPSSSYNDKPPPLELIAVL